MQYHNCHVAIGIQIIYVMVMEACFQPHSKSHKHRIRGTYYHDDIHVNRAVYKPTQMQKTEFWTPLKIWITRTK